MTAPLVLVLFTVVAATHGRSFLLRAAWTESSPRWGIWAWQSLSVAVATAVVLTAVTLAVPLLPVRSHLAELARISPLALDHHYTTPGGPGIAAAALALALVIMVRVVVLTALTVHHAARGRRQQLDTLTLVGVRHPDGYDVLEHPTPLVYCLPGRRRRVVVTTGALDLLSPHELGLVLAHERTHLRARHDLALALSGALSRTFGALAVFRDAHAHIATLAEMHADDVATATGDRRAMARALIVLTVGRGTVPEAADRGQAGARVRRLTSSGLPLRPRQGVAVAFATLALLSMPVGLAIAPAVEASTLDCCDPTGL